MPQPVPVAPGSRVETLDVLRGFALLGILAMNIRAMAGPIGTYLYPYALWDYEGASRAAYVSTSVFFDLKMMGLFSMLFGAGALLYAAKPTPSGQGPTGLWFRRMFWLLVIGLVHAYLIWGGDILVTYALSGMILLWWVRRLSVRNLALMAALWLGIGAFLSVGHGLAWEGMSEADRAAEAAMMMPTGEQAQAQLADMHGSYLEVVAASAPTVFMFQTMYFPLFFFWRAGGMMLLGMSLYKSGFLEGRKPNRTYATTAAVCLPLGLGLAWYGTAALEAVRFEMPARAFHDLWNYFGAVLASVGYAAAIVWLVRRGALGPVRRALAAVGRMAFTNYLMQSVITSVLFLGWGFGAAGALDYAEQLWVVAAIWTFQLVASPFWLARFRFGPAEWLWRSLTYRELQPMRRGADLAAASSPLPGVRRNR